MIAKTPSILRPFLGVVECWTLGKIGLQSKVPDSNDCHQAPAALFTPGSPKGDLVCKHFFPGRDGVAGDAVAAAAVGDACATDGGSGEDEAIDVPGQEETQGNAAGVRLVNAARKAEDRLLVIRRRVGDDVPCPSIRIPGIRFDPSVSPVTPWGSISRERRAR